MVGEEGGPRQPAGRDSPWQGSSDGNSHSDCLQCGRHQSAWSNSYLSIHNRGLHQRTDSATLIFLPPLAGAGRLHPGDTALSRSFGNRPWPVQMEPCAKSKVGLLEMPGLWREQDFSKPGVPCDEAWKIIRENHFPFVCVRCPQDTALLPKQQLGWTLTPFTCLGTGTRAGCVKCKGQESLFSLQAQRCNTCSAPGPLHFSEMGDI